VRRIHYDQQGDVVLEVRFLINTVNVHKFGDITMVVRLLIFVVICLPIFRFFIFVYILLLCNPR